ncbi:IclR family transcriptional regulator [Mycolicibacterium novocastrense]|uniref:IclR family transcriptional regulator n=1 Tax=Mycolicibacterium novocastrense TaxID=59813 RepID=UPI0009EC9653|nr:helix-turn-helix domain-containing protein [Mycolicibacterium novocastrense]
MPSEGGARHRVEQGGARHRVEQGGARQGTEPISVVPNGAPGSQTLARGLAALQLVASSPTGLTAQQVADDIGVHRTIAYRLLSTLSQFRLVAKGEDGRYRSAAALAVLGASFDNNVRQLSLPTLRGLADELSSTVSLLVAEGDQQVAIAVVVPTNVFYQLSFHEGSRYPLDRGAAGIALLASMPPRPDERDLVPLTREQGWVITHGEIEPNTYGLAVPVRRRPPAPPTCINLISHREDVLTRGRDAVIRAADELSAILN